MNREGRTVNVKDWGPPGSKESSFVRRQRQSLDLQMGSMI